MRPTGLHRLLPLAVCALFLLLCGGTALLSGGVYRAVATSSDENFAKRTALFYVVNQVKSARDSGGAVRVEPFGDGDALVLGEASGPYTTTVYCYDGALMELYADGGDHLPPEAGTVLLPMEALAVKQSGALLALSLTEETGRVLEAEVAAW
ncbi:MAG: DUF4860 domain-containing protein [Oscillibacter sp.]